MPVPLLGVRSQRRCASPERPRDATTSGSAAQDRRWRARGRRWIHRAARLRHGRRMSGRGGVATPTGKPTTREARAMWTRTLTIVAAAVVAALGPAMLTAQSVVNYTAVTEQRLLAPEPHNWLMYRGTYNGWGYSPLEQITPANVKKLVPVWSFSTGVTEGHQSPPIVNNGVMFITTPQQQVFALNAKTGDLIWRYRKELPEDLLQLHPTNRGVALWGDRVYVARSEERRVGKECRARGWPGLGEAMGGASA